MQVTCPQCRKRYQLDASKIGARGVRVRCPACQKQFQVTPSEESAPTHVRPQEPMVFKSEPAGINQQPIRGEIQVPAIAAAEGEETNEFRRQEPPPDGVELTPLPPPRDEGVFTDRERAEDDQAEEVESAESSAPAAADGQSARYRIPLRYVFIPALLPMAVFALYLLLLHYPQLLHLRLSRHVQDTLDTAPLKEETRNLYLKAKFWQYLDDPATQQRAAALLDQALAMQPDQPKLLGAKAELLAYSIPAPAPAGANQAVSLAVRALVREPQNREALRVLAYTYLESDEAVASYYLNILLQQVFRGFLETTDAETRWLLARQHRKHGNLLEAQLNLEKAVELNPYFIRCYLELAEISRQQNDLEKERRYRGLYETMRLRLHSKIEQETAG